MKALATSTYRVAQGVFLLLAIPFANSVSAAEPQVGATDAGNKAVEEIIVTGSYIKGSAEDAALPVDVISQQDMQAQGSPTLLELVRNLGVTAGNIGEENQFQPGAGQGQGAVTTINLRGLGSARTLVLVNGKRHVTQADIGVDLSFMPANALARTEILKDGAAALYGSDAIAGVVNLITRGDFEGFEIGGSNVWMEDSDGQQNANMIWGTGNDRWHFMTAFEFEARQELKVRDRSWALRPRPENPAGGWTGFGNPATLFPAVYNIAGGPFLGTSGILAGSQPDSQCNQLGGQTYGGTPAAPTSCAGQYTFFDNIVNPENSYKSWTEFNYNISDSAVLHLEGLYTRINFETNTSPSYAAQSLFGPDRWIAPDHPGLVQYKLDNPGSNLNSAFPGAGAYALSRAFLSTGWFGDSQRGNGQTNTYRVGASLVGDVMDDAVHYDMSVNYSHRERVTETPDTSVERMAFALDGMGGPSCVRASVADGGGVPGSGNLGTGNCFYYNPFDNAIPRSVINGAVNPFFKPELANDPSLALWLIQKQQYNVVDELLVWDGVVSGDTPIKLPGGNVGVAVGFQARNEKYNVGLNDIANRAVSPCPFNDQYSVTLGNISQTDFNACQQFGGTPQLVTTGELGFLSAYDESRAKRTVYAAFSELAVPVTDTVDMQFAVRFEDYGQPVGSTVDPKAAIRWQVTDWLTLRASASTTFRGPPQSYLSGRATTLQFVVPTNSFKAVDIVGNPNLEPETAVVTSAGFIVNLGGFSATLDYWEYNFKKPFQTESQGQMINLYSLPSAGNPGGLGCQAAVLNPDGTIKTPAGPGFGTTTCNELSLHIFPLGTPPAALSRVDTYIVNGSDIVTSGFDGFIQYSFNLFGGELALGGEGTYTSQYTSDDFQDVGGTVLAPGGDFVGKYNLHVNPFFPIPELKGNLFARYTHGGLSLSGTMRYIDGYTDQAPSVPNLKNVDSMTTYDVTALYNWRAFTIAGSVFNLADEKPPRVSADLNYDPVTFSALGRLVKLQLTYSLGQ